MDKKELAVITVITFIVVAIWIASAILGTKSTIPNSPKLETLLKNLNPDFDQSLIDQIGSIPTLPRSQKVLVNSPTSTTSATPTPSSQVATSGGTLR